MPRPPRNPRPTRGYPPPPRISTLTTAHPQSQNHADHTSANHPFSISARMGAPLHPLPSANIDSPDAVLQRQMTVLETQPEILSENPVLLFGEQPPWGWDYIFAFKLPRSLRRSANNASSPSRPPGTSILPGNRRPSGNDSDFFEPELPELPLSGGDDAIAKGADEKSRRLIRQRVEILARLKSAGFVFSQVQVPSENQIFVRFSLPEARLKEKAELLGMELRLKPEYGGGYLSFSLEREDVFINSVEQHGRDCYFSPSDRTIIILNVLQGQEDWCCAFNIESMIFKGTLLQAFALHSLKEYPALVQRAVWERVWDPTWKPPLQELKDYLGARVAFYFVFVTFYAKRLLLMGLIAIPVNALYFTIKRPAIVTLLQTIYSACLVIWTTYFLETWKRRNAEVSIEWGLNDYHEDMIDETRAQFKGEMKYGFYSEGGFVPVDDLIPQSTPGALEPSGAIEEGRIQDGLTRLPQSLVGNPFKEKQAIFISASVTIFFVVLVGSLTFLLLWFREEIVGIFHKRTDSRRFGELVPGIINGLLITLFDAVWRSVSYRLTKRENHRTNQLFEDSLIYKRFAFQFVSNYVSLFYIAFIQPYIDRNRGHDPQKFMNDLGRQLMVLVVTRSTIGQILEIGFPFVTSRVKQWRARRNCPLASTRGTRCEASGEKLPGGKSPESSADNRYAQESKLAQYETTMEDYGELVIQFGYLALFGLAFPLASLVSLLNNLVEVRSDAFKVLVLSQRTNADDAADIGAWYYTLEFLNVLGVATNVGLLVFTGDALTVLFGLDGEFWKEESWRKLLYQVVAFFVIEHVLLAVKAVTAFGIKDIPKRTHQEGARRRFDIARHFNIGWEKAFRGGQLLSIDERQIMLCAKYGDVFERASDDGGGDEEQL